jgi:hypothetical protein
VGGLFFGGSVFGSVGGAASQDYAIGTGTITIDVTAAATRAQVTGNRDYAGATAIIQTSASVVINGVSFTTQAGTTTLQSFVDQINSQTSVTGVVAELVPNGANLNVRLRAGRIRRQLLRNGQRRTGDSVQRSDHCQQHGSQRCRYCLCYEYRRRRRNRAVHRR